MHEPGSNDSSLSEGSLSAPMLGTILDVMVKNGQRVREGQTLLVMEAMKMEHRIQAPRAGEASLRCLFPERRQGRHGRELSRNRRLEYFLPHEDVSWREWVNYIGSPSITME